jgi:hypothetical protein
MYVPLIAEAATDGAKGTLAHQSKIPQAKTVIHFHPIAAPYPIGRAPEQLFRSNVT